MILDDLVHKARREFGVSENADGDELKSIYISLADSILSRANSAPDLNTHMDMLNLYLEVLLYKGKHHASKLDLFTFCFDTATESAVSDHCNSPRFPFYCWNPLLLDFSSFEFGYLSPSDSSRAIQYNEMQQHFLPYRNLCRVLILHKYELSLKRNRDIIHGYLAAPTPSTINETLVVRLVRPSFFGRSNNIESMIPGVPLMWRTTKENERYPYSIEILTNDGLSLGELPTDLSVCLTPLLENNIIQISVFVKGIDRRQDRGRYARFSHLDVSLQINTISPPPLEVYFLK